MAMLCHFNCTFDMMNEIILDCDLMRHPNSGLYRYCLDLGNSLSGITEDNERVRYYVPPAEKDAFDDPAASIVEKRYHRFFRPFLSNCKVWHAPFQSWRIIPPKENRAKVVLTIHDLNALHEGKSKQEQLSSIAHTQALIDRSDALICISEFTKRDVIENCHTYNKPVHVIHNGAQRPQDGVLHASSYKPTRPFLFGIGYVNVKKNYHV